jgi:hypothetical protein
MIMPAQYWISGGSKGGGVESGDSFGEGRKVKHSTREKMFMD